MYEQFAAGGMATLHYGRLLGPSGFSRTVAIKRLHTHLSEDPEFVAMFLDEARLAARIHHPNVIQTLDVESSEGELFVVLDYVHGDSLSRLLREARRLEEIVTPSLVAAILFGALEGLHAAHEARDAKGEPLELVHRDVSPHNVLVGTDGIARVLDFGVAKARGRAQTTRVGQLKGKIAYMAPEQLRGKATRRSDVFAASVVLWEALTGTRLFNGEDEGDVIDKLLHETIPRPRKYAPLVTAELEAVVMRGLERDPARRYATAREMAVALESHVALSTPIEVGAFVARVGGSTLAQRAARVAAIEGAAGDVLAEGDATNGAAFRPAAASLTGATSPTLPVPGLALPESEKADDTTVEAPGTGVATVSDAHAPLRRRRLSAVRVASVVAALTLLVSSFLVRSRPADSSELVPSVAPAVAPPPPSAAPVAPEIGAARAPVDVVPARVPSPEPPRKKSAAQPARSRALCAPPYTVDGRGLRHYKPECL